MGAVVGQSQERKEKPGDGGVGRLPSAPLGIDVFCCGAVSRPRILHLHLTSQVILEVYLSMRSSNITACLPHLELVKWLDV